MPLAVGVDAGGSWVRVLALARGRRAARVRVPVARTSDLSTALGAAWSRRGWGRRDVAALVVASKGLWTPAECHRLARRLRGLAVHVEAIPDAQAAALGALGERPGVLALAGTGSIVVGHDGRGNWARAGGLGPFLGDEGSGFWLAREWLRATTRGNFKAVRALAHAPSPVAAIATLAPRVIARARRGERQARAVVRAGQRHLAALVVDVARRLRLPQPVDASWAGSVLGNAWFRAGLMRAVTRAGLRARWRAPELEPVVAAARRAARLAHRRATRRS